MLVGRGMFEEFCILALLEFGRWKFGALSWSLAGIGFGKHWEFWGE
jgi:hypothetical protein